MIVTVDMIREGRKARTVTKTVWPWSCTATLEVAHLGWMYTLHPTHASHRWSRQTPQPFTPASGPEAGQGPASVLVTHIEKLFFSRHSTYRQPVLMSAPPVRANIAEPIRGTQPSFSNDRATYRGTDRPPSAPPPRSSRRSPAARTRGHEPSRRRYPPRPSSLAAPTRTTTTEEPRQSSRRTQTEPRQTEESKPRSVS